MTIFYAGLALGAVYSIIAICYNLTFTTAGVLNFAAAHTVMVGSFVAAWGLSATGVNVLVTVLLCAAVGAGIGMLIELTAIAPLRRQTRGNHAELVTTVGASIVITGVAFLLWGTAPRTVPLFENNARISLLFGDVRPADLALIATAVSVGLGLHFGMRRSKVGLASLAQFEDRDAAMLQGINVRRLSLFGFAAAGALGSALGVVVGAKTMAVVSVALVIAVKGFVALVLGGVGNQLGALVGGAILGLGEAVTGYWLGGEYRLLIVFLIFVTVLLVRPQGIFGVKEGRLV